ncbi:GntR family transcriptional regulator [Streptomyces melanosporofaciens]|uniref:DNA-binding transcriptional regulator, GntR family n=1 Tax=Streptomyces melanosporofaciens TaxID=67327 RepID=A0A1H4KLE7_STRMJ|nr:GntR family transcriptional regulator [Streptomyces melanosporofaciens]SEB59389.1 DNA-binding transcriptional regulator, GntR family [Streptomyces melanosporofaciens]
MTPEHLGLRIERTERLLRDRVTDVVREAILQGDLEPGRRLTERELGELTGVSRTSLREALRSLQAEGLVERSETRGLKVAVLSESVVSELYDVRAALEPAAVELFVRNASDDQVRQLVDTLKTLPDDTDGLDLSRRFYRVLLSGAANSTMRQMIESIETRIHSLRRLSLSIAGRAEASANELREVARLIHERDASAAAASARQHVLAAKAAALQTVRGTQPT